ncbi:lantibiotic dehydratase [Dermatophilaceae bacterium Soc4.6]
MTTVGTRTALAEEATAPLPAILAPFRVDRVAGLSVAALDLDATSFDDVCAELEVVDRSVQELAETVSDLLYRLVPALDDDTATRRIVLAVRRTCASGTRRPRPDETERVATALQDRLDRGARDLFDQWVLVTGRREELLAQLETTHADESERAGQALRQALCDERLAAGIAQASPWLGQSLRTADLRPGRRAARSVGAYVTRAARKTSPFSWLTSVSASIDLTGEPGESEELGECPAARRGAPVEGLTVSLVHLVAWLDALAADEHLLQAFELEPLWTPGRNPLADAVLVPEVMRQEGFAWRQDRSVHLQELGRILGKLQLLGRRPAGDYLAAVGGEDAFAAVRRLVDVGVLRVVAPWAYGETDRLSRLAEALERLGNEQARAVATTLRGLGADVAALAAVLGPERGRALVAVRARAEEAIAAFGVAASEAAFTVYSDISTTTALTGEPLGRVVDDELLSLGAALRPMVFRSHLYDLLLDRFTARYGVGGSCDDLVDFLSTVFDTGADGLAGVLRAVRADEATKGTPTPRASLPVGHTSGPPSTSVLYQLAASSFEDVRRGDFALVVNQLHTGSGSLVSRFHGLDRGSLRQALQSWSAQLYPGARVVEFVASCDTNDMQSACEGTFPRLRWPTERPLSGDPVGSLDLGDLVLTHDAERQVLEFSAGDGSPVAPVYMGLVPAHLLGGAERVLAMLADPWVNGASSAWRRLPPLPAQGEGTRILPRRQRGRLVVRRATWTVRAADLPRAATGESAASFLRRLNVWRRGEGIPDHVFLRVRAAGGGFATDERKPSFLSFLSPHSVAQLLTPLDSAVQGLTFTEVAPGDTDLWLTATDGTSSVVEHLTHLRWARPAPAAAVDGDDPGTGR